MDLSCGKPVAGKCEKRVHTEKDAGRYYCVDRRTSGKRGTVQSNEGREPDGDRIAVTVSEEGFENKDMLTVTDLILFGKEGTAQRLLQDELTGNIYAVNNAFIAIVNNALIDEQNGEHRVERPYFNPITGILWKNNVCKMRAAFRSNDEKNIKIMKNLEGVDITPEIPG